MRKNTFLDIRKILFIWLFMALAIGLSYGFKFHLSFNQPKLEDQAYSEYAHSIIYHHDLNNYRLGDTFVSETKNRIDFYSWGAGIFLVPAHVFSDLLDRVGLAKISCFWEYDIASTVGSIIFFFGFVYFSLEIFRKLDLSLSNKDFLIFLLGTPLLWYSFFDIMSNQIFLLAYLSFAINLALDLEYSFEKKSYIKFIFLGAVFAFSYIIDPVGFLYWIGFFTYLIIIFRKRGNVSKVLFFYFLGGVSVILFDLVSVQIKFGQILTPIFFIQKDYFGFFSKKFLLTSSFFGPQGMFYLCPIYILCCYGFFSYFESKKSVSEKDLRIRSLVTVLLAIFAVSVFIKTWYWFPTTLIYGKNLLEHQLLFVLGFSFFIKRITFFRKLLLGLCVVWNVLWLMRYFADKSNFGFFYEWPDFNFLKLIFWRLQMAIMFSISSFPQFLMYFFAWAFFIAVIFFGFRNIFVKKQFWKLGAMVLAAFFMITLSNLIFNQLNAKHIISVAVLKNPDAYFFPELLKDLKLKRTIAQVNGKSDMRDILEKRIRETENTLMESLPSLLIKKEFNDGKCREDWIED